jgi:hypothetical protein
MLAGRRSLDAAMAVRFARSLQLPAERLMQLQLRHDFAEARRLAELENVGPFQPPPPGPFPERHLRGRLGLADSGASEASLFFQRDVAETMSEDAFAGLHALWSGDRLRIYGANRDIVWDGPILHNLDGHILFPFVREDEWLGWFAAGLRAELALGEAHRASLERTPEPDRRGLV